MGASIICERAFGLAHRLVPLCERMARLGFVARHVAGQLIEAGTSVAANANEAQEGQTKADYIAKMSIARKEARETCFWLQFAAAAGIVKSVDVQWERQEAYEVLRMIRSAIRTAQSSPSRGKAPSPLP